MKSERASVSLLARNAGGGSGNQPLRMKLK